MAIGLVALVGIGLLLPEPYSLAAETVVNQPLAEAQAAEARRQAEIERLLAVAADDPENAEALSDLANAFLAGSSAEDLQRAAFTLLALIGLDPEDPEPYGRLITAYIRADDWTDAAAATDALADLAPDSPDVPFFRGLIAWQGDGDADAAITAFDEFLAMAPDDAAGADDPSPPRRGGGRPGGREPAVQAEPRDLDPERRADALLALETNRSAVGLGDVTDDREPQARTGTAEVARFVVLFARGPRSVDLVEAFEDPLPMSERDPDSVIGDPEPDSIVDRVPAEANLSPSVAVLHRVVGKVQERLRQPGRVGGDANPLGVVTRSRPHRANRDIASRGDRPDALRHVVQHPSRVDRLHDELCLARLDHRQVQQLVHELGEVVNLALDLNSKFAAGLDIADRAIGQRLGEELDGCQGRPQLVADVRDDVAAGLPGPPGRCDVVQGEEQAAPRGAEAPASRNDGGKAGRALPRRSADPPRSWRPARARRAGLTRTPR